MRVVITTIAEDYTWVSMVAEIGGYVGLFLGVAVLDCVYVLEAVWPKMARLRRKGLGQEESKTEMS